MAENSYGNVFPNGERIPESVRAQIMAAQLMQQAAAQANQPYTSKGVNALKGLSGLFGGLMEGSSIHGEQAAQAAHRTALASLLAQPQGGAAPSIGMAGAPAPGQSITPTSGSFTSGNPAGYDPKSTEALIRQSAAKHGVDPDTAVAVARSEGLGGYTGDKGSSFGPFQLHYGNVAGGGNAVGGMGDDFTKQTGLDARDPSTVPQQVDFAMKNAAQNGWGAWHGAKNSGIGNFQGIGQATKTADMPAPNATPTGSSSLPPGITPDMVSAPSPYGGQPQPMSQLVPSPYGGPPKPMSSPFGGAPQPMAPPNPQQAAMVAALLQGASATPPPPAPTVDPAPSPQPDGPSSQPDSAPGPQVAMSSGVDPAMMTQQPDSGSGSMLPADPPLPPQNPQSPFGGPPQPMTPPPAVPPSAMAQALLQGAPPMSAAPLSTAHLPGMDNFDSQDNVTQSSTGGQGFTGSFNDGIGGAINGNLPPPQAMAGGPGPAAPPAPAASLPQMAAGNLPPPMAGPTPQNAALASALQSPAPGSGAALPPTGPMPPAGAQTLNPDAPAPGAMNAGPAPLPPSAMAAALQAAPMGLAGKSSGADPMSAQNFNLAQALRGGGSSPSPSVIPVQSSPLPPAPGGAPPTAPVQPAPMASSPMGATAPSSGGIGDMFSRLLGGQPAAAPQQQSAATAGMSPQQQAYMSILADPRTSPQEAEMILQRVNPAPMKLGAGEGLVGRRPDGSYGSLYTQAPKADYEFNADTGLRINKADGSVTPVAPPKGDFEMNRDGLVVNKRTGTVVQGQNGSGYRLMTPEEKQAANLPADAVLQIGPNGQLHSPGGQTINVGGEQNVYDTKMATTLAENHVGLMQGIEGNRTKLRDLNAMSGALQRIQANGGTTGIGQEEIKQLQGAVNTGSNALGLGQQYDISDKEVMEKLARQISGAQAKDIGGARTTNFDMQTMLSANPGLALSATGNQRMLGIGQQVTQRNIDIGQQMQDAAAAAVQQGRRVNPQAMEQIRADYDQSHHIIDPITKQDLSVSSKLPEFNGGAAQPAQQPPTASAQPPAQQQGQPAKVQSAADYASLPSGAQFTDPNGVLRTKR